MKHHIYMVTIITICIGLLLIGYSAALVETSVSFSFGGVLQQSIARSYSYIIGISGANVQLSDGITGQLIFQSTDASAVINNAISKMKNGGILCIKAGTYNVANIIEPFSNTTITGEGDATVLNFTANGMINLANPICAIENLSVYSANSIQDGSGLVLITANQSLVTNVSGNCDNTSIAVFYVFANNRIVDNVQFSNCNASGGGFGFLNSGDGNCLISNINYTDCNAINCGRYSRYNTWVTGFDLAELNDLKNCFVINCESIGSWESGFHFEEPPIKTNVHISCCTSEDNGQKPNPIFGAGYVISTGITLDSDFSSNNKLAAVSFCNNKNGSIQINDFTDIGSYYGLEGSGDASLVLLSNYTTITSSNLAVYLTDATNIDGSINIINPNGAESGICTLFGTIANPISNCSFDIFATGGQQSFLIYTQGSNNLVFTGIIQTTQQYPFFNYAGTNVVTSLIIN